MLHRDYETRGTIPLKKAGIHRYASDPSTELLCCAYAIDNGPVQLWVPGDPGPQEIIEATRNLNWLVAAHGDHFETAIEQHILGPRFGWPQVPLKRHCCTMAMARATGLPARLSAVADALELANRKDAAGERLMHQMRKPRRPRKDEDPAGRYWFDDDERLQRLYAYCRQDVETERELYGRLLALSPTEHVLWQLTAHINDRGFHIDRQFAEAARRIARAAAPAVDQELADLTGGAATKITQVAKLLAWLQEHGCAIGKLDRDTIRRQLDRADDEGLSPAVRRALELRLSGAQAAVTKIDALLARAGDDNRVRGSFNFCGASTGRWGDYAHVKERYKAPLSIVGDCSRAMIVAAPGHTLIGADFSAIESRTLASAAGERWKVGAYERFDATHDPADEPYRATAARILHKLPEAITKEERGIGKICDLAFGYQGGLNAWRKFEPDRFTDEEVQRFKNEWRAAHPNIRKFWYNLDRAAWTAVRERGRVVRCGPVAFKCSGAFLQLKLPSGRKISYPYPRVIGDEREQRVLFSDNSEGRFRDCRNGQGAYGGLWTENIISGIARDILAEAMLRLEGAGYPIVLHVHDEIVCEIPIGFGSTEEFTRLMTRRPGWALDLPIAASAWSGPRYTKGD